MTEHTEEIDPEIVGEDAEPFDLSEIDWDVITELREDMPGTVQEFLYDE